MYNISFVDKIKTHFMFNTYCPENLAVCEIMWRNMAETDRLHMTIHYGTCALLAG
jgi:hypothetical protein